MDSEKATKLSEIFTVDLTLVYYIGQIYVRWRFCKVL